MSICRERIRNGCLNDNVHEIILERVLQLEIFYYSNTKWSAGSFSTSISNSPCFRPSVKSFRNESRGAHAIVPPSFFVAAIFIADKNLQGSVWEETKLFHPQRANISGDLGGFLPEVYSIRSENTPEVDWKYCYLD